MLRICIVVLLLFSVLSAQNADYFQQDVSYRIDITLDPVDNRYSGKETITYTNNSSDVLEYVWLHLYPNAFKDDLTPYARQQKFARQRKFYFSEEKEKGYIKLTSVESAGKKITWHFKEDAVDEAQLILPQALGPGETIEIDLEFEARFSKVFSRSGHFNNEYFQGTQWYPKIVVYDRHGWHPDSNYEIGEYYGEFGTFDVRITLPANYVIDATGVLQENPHEEAFIDSIIADSKRITEINDAQKRNTAWKQWREQHRAKTINDSLKTVRFVAENVHDFAWFAGVDFMIHQKVAANGVLARVLTLPKNVYDWRHVPDIILRTLDFYGKKVGSYKYPKATVVDGSQIIFGGMEYPMITVITMNYQNWNNLFENVIVHEVGHNWFQGMLGSDERANVFMDEGINSFYDGLYTTHYYGENGLTQFDSLLGNFNILDDVGDRYYHTLLYSQRIATQMDVPMNLRGDQYSRTNYSIVNYSKGVFLLKALQWMMGADKFDQAMHEYFERWHFKHPELDDFWGVMQEFSDTDLARFRREWMETTHYNDFEIADYETVQTGNGFETKIYVKNNGTMKNLPAPVYLITMNGDTLEGRWSGQEEVAVTMQHESPLKKLEVNLKKIIFEFDYLNNSTFLPDLEFTFLRPVPSFDTYKFTFYPLLGYEYFVDGIRLGAGFWAGNFVTSRYFLAANFYVGTESGTAGYKIKFKHRLPGFIANYTDMSLGLHDKDGFKGINAHLETEYINPYDTSIRYNILVGIDDSKLYEQRYHEKGLYQENRYTTAKLEFTTKFRQMLWRDDLKLLVEKTIDLFDTKADYLKYELSNRSRFYFSETSNVLWDLYLGSVRGNNTPLQELIFAGGDIDPKHLQDVPGYRGSIAPLRGFSLDKGMQMLGHSHVNRVFLKSASGFATGLEFDLPYIPKIYGRLAGLFERFDDFGNDVFYEAGVRLGDNNFSMIFPVYISDPAPQEENIDFRFFFNYTLPF